MAKLVIRKGEEPRHSQPTRRIVISKGPSAVAEQISDGRYRIDRVIGEGGSGRVFLARDMLLDMDVAIKSLNPSLVRDKAAIEALKSETRICLGLVHPNIIRIYNLEKRGPTYLLIMEYLKGETLQAMLSRHPGGLPADFVRQVIDISADALAYAHRHGVIHKDVKPGNIFVTDDDVLKVIDFGIASVAGAGGASGEFVVGTPEYMSPEQLRGDALTTASDTYSLAVLAHMLLTGRTLHPADATINDMAFSPHPPIDDVAEPVRVVLEQATAFDPGERHASIAAFGSAFHDATA